ncbi:Hypothetical_protein [Hexamita inflata]|uniref:Hypothetical_protein n=1 Tax=Hexamita inflata TaxID=28002 RepID=A0AA86NXC7_9EUKA|nr:Hypothetical protein HINF_LOCUS14602 [Hexamita inflata]
MNSITNEQQLICAIQRYCELTNNDYTNIIYQVLVLPDTTYNLLFCQLSFDLNMKLETIHTLFTELSTKYLYVNLLSFRESFNIQQNLSAIVTEMQTVSQYQNHKFLVIEKRNIQSKIDQSDKIPLQQFKQEFLETVKTIMMEFDIRANQMIDKEVCQVLKQYFQSHDQKLFWERVQQQISYKTVLQLKQYYQKSFLQCQYEQISKNDKQKIVQLIRVMPQSKPSEIVNIFFNEIGSEIYFRRKVIMLVIYLQRLGQK